MSPVECPSCGGKGSIPTPLLGKKIRCQKCGSSFVAGAPTPSLHPHSTAPAGSPPAGAPPAASTALASNPGGETIEVDGLDAESWASTSEVAVALVAPDHEAAFTALPSGAEGHPGSVRRYKLLTQKDRFFGGQFDLGRLEEALNHYAQQGWVVRAMSTPLVTGFSGGPREEIVVLMER